ncbi:hypothetical protein QT381_12860 [Galbitalea sp. SE-J8]|uniref:hypothetical protein n=1 Tax=Galbitalea sp. SE-J8 TaxID=3054952 RepID=UPI00259C8B1E|nr:hypothetical protein [Galbitalea sp. SE-J8]MDM4763900.1 hypothetical protein [Galbitalea sp. SE-J8]
MSDRSPLDRTPEALFARLRTDDDRWVDTDYRTDAAAAGPAPHPSRWSASALNPAHWPLWAQLGSSLAVGAAIALVIVLGVGALRAPTSVSPPAHTPSPSPTASSPVAGATLDDGRIVNAALASVLDTKVEPVVTVPATLPTSAPGGSASGVIDPATQSSAPWAVVSGSPDADTIAIGYVADGDFGDCGAHVGVAVVEDATSVTIAAVSAAADDSCTELLALGGGTVQLAAPLGDRTLFHAPLSAPWATIANPIVTVEPGTSTPDPGTCDALFSADRRAAFEDDHLVLDGGPAGDGYAQKAVEEWASSAADQRAGLADVVQFGGLACRWGVENGDSSIPFGFGPITDEQTAAMQAYLDASGAKRVEEDGWVRYTGDGELAFGDGWWARVYDNLGLEQQGVDALAELVAANPHPGAFGGGASATSVPGDGATGDPTHNPTGTATPSSTPTGAYVTTGGYGDLRLGKPVPDDTTLVEWKPDQCYAGRWTTPGVTEVTQDPVTVRTDGNERAGKILFMVFTDATITTKSGAHVGMTEAELKRTLPNAQKATTQGATIYTVSDAVGMLMFEFQGGTVWAITLVDAGSPVESIVGDGYGPCYGG